MFFGGGFPGGFPGGHPGMGGGGRREPVDNQSYYKLLGVPQSASQEEIRKNYRKLAREHHPDKGGDEKLFKEIQEAYDCLSDPEKKELYDQGGKEAVERGGGGGGGHDDLLSALFGGGGGRRQSRGPQKGESVVHKIQVSLENLFNGKTFKMAISRQRVKYPAGMTSDQAATVCKTCGGAGAVLKTQRMGPMLQQVQMRCPDCGGQGKSFKEGVSVFQEKKTLEVRVDPGMKHGQKIVMAGEADENPGMEAGDVVFVLVQQDHPVFQRKGADLVMEKQISLKDALCGVKFGIKHLDDRTIVIKTAPGQVIKPNSLKMIAAEGMPLWKRPFERGRLFILFKVTFPDTLDANTVKVLSQALPAGVVEKVPSGDHVEEIESPMVETTIEEFGRVNYAAESGQAYESDDEEGGHGGPGGGQRVQCANQ
jgi:DnaJ family protein A protein 2